MVSQMDQKCLINRDNSFLKKRSYKKTYTGPYTQVMMYEKVRTSS